MNLKEIKSYITTMKLHLDQIDRWMVQANQMVHDLEDNIMDIEDNKFKDQSFTYKNNFDSLKMSVETYGVHNLRT